MRVYCIYIASFFFVHICLIHYALSYLNFVDLPSAKTRLSIYLWSSKTLVLSLTFSCNF